MSSNFWANATDAVDMARGKTLWDGRIERYQTLRCGDMDGKRKGVLV